jgi:outer membrane protein TolC
MKRLFLLFFILNIVTFLGQNSQAQDSITATNNDVAKDSLTSIMTLSEYLGYVKRYHPIVKQANLVINNSEAKLLKARGAFDPKIEVDFDQKLFKEKEYFDKLNATFKVPTWYGIEFKANFEDNSGEFLNPEATADNLYSAGISASLLKGFLMNERMADIKQAKLFLNQAKEDQQILVNNILYEASVSYFSWLKAYNEKRVYTEFLNNANFRFNATKRAYAEGDKPAVDTLEAGIFYKSRLLDLEKARIKYVKTSLELSNFLWLADNTPVELQSNIIPDTSTLQSVDNTFNIALFNNENFDINEHPKIKSLQFKIESLDVERRLKLNSLLPKLDVNYNFLSPNENQFTNLNTDNYKAGIKFSVPLFLRKERGNLKLATIKLNDMQFENEASRVSITNKIDAIQQELDSYIIQSDLTNNIVADYQVLLKAEERKFFVGASSLFLVNYREVKLIESRLKAIDLENKFFKSKASLFKAAVIQINE